MIILDYVEKPQTGGKVISRFLGIDNLEELVIVTADDLEEGFVSLFVG